MSLSRSHKPTNGPRVEINVVPLVDVSLVLLIIFMVTATFMKSAGMHIQLPTSSTTQSAAQEKREIVIGVDARDSLLWQEQIVSADQLAGELQKEAKTFGTESRVVVQGDDRASHGRIVQAMTLAQEAGFSKLVISTRPGARTRHER